MVRNKSLFLLPVFFLVGCGAASESMDPNGAAQITSASERQLVQPDRAVGGNYTRATDEYGPSVIWEGETFVESKIIPWSGSLYPLRDSSLFEASSSPLRKYDLFNYKRNVKTKAAEYHKAYIYQPDADDSIGHSTAWALASILEPEPVSKRPATIDGVLFTPADLKALLVLSYDEVDGLMQVGEKGEVYADQFHRLVQKELFEGGKPFLINKGQGDRVWSIPVYNASVKITPDAQDSYLAHVQARLEGIEPVSGEVDLNTSQRKKVVFEYTYDLYGYPKGDGSLEVVYGLWTGTSLKNHPEFLLSVPGDIARGSYNPNISAYIVDEIVSRSKTDTSAR
jgi:hypothetical protein